MRIIKSISGMSKFSEGARRRGLSIGLVPTMGCLHDGHMSLAAAAREENDIVVISVFVNPAQFGPGEDLKKYPRTFKDDVSLAKEYGVDVIFYPPAKEMYPEDYSTYVNVEWLSEPLCGKRRPGHFRGVATVVTKLFNIIRPDEAYFGQKDAQQAAVIRRMAKDLNTGVNIKVSPIVREFDGLAMSSRNRYLSLQDRKDAPVLYKALTVARSLAKSGQKDAREITREMRRTISAVRSARVDYIEIVDPRTLERVETIDGAALAALAVYFKKTRLIDNMIVRR